MRRILLALALLSCLPMILLAQTPSYDNGGLLQFQMSDNTTSGNLTVGAGSNRYLIVCAYSRNNQTITGVTATKGGMATAMTLLATKTETTFGTATLQMFGIVQPDSGSNAIIATGSGTPLAVAGAWAIAFADVDQSTPVSNTTSADGLGTATTVTVTSAAGKVVADCTLGPAGATTGASTVGAGQTQRVSARDTVVGLTGDSALASTEAGGASVAMTWTLTDASAWIAIGTSLNGAAAATGSSRNLRR